MLSSFCTCDGLQAGVVDAWKSFDVATVNDNAVRFRVMENRVANWHVHDDSDELFYVVSGTVTMDTDEGARESIEAWRAEHSGDVRPAVRLCR